MTMEGWGDIARTVMRQLPGMVLFFLLFLMVTSFAIMNLIIAVIRESTFASAHETEQELEQADKGELLELLEKIPQVFNDIDVNNDGVVTKEELQLGMEPRPDVFDSIVGDAAPLKNDAEALFHMLDVDGSGSVRMQELVAGFLRLKGFHDQQLDSLSLLVQLRQMKYRLGALEERIDQKFKVRKGASTRPQSAPSDPGSAVTAKSSEILELKSALQWVSWSRSRLNGEGPPAGPGPGGISTASTETGPRRSEGDPAYQSPLRGTALRDARVLMTAAWRGSQEWKSFAAFSEVRICIRADSKTQI